MNRRAFLANIGAVGIVSMLPALPVAATPQPYNWDRHPATRYRNNQPI